MRTLWVDAGNGAAGDMLLAALLDAGADLDAVRSGLRGLAVEPLDVSLSQVRRHGLRAAHADVRAAETGVSRNLADVAAVVAKADLPAPVREFALAVFERLARAEARVHGVDLSQIHFHEVGALDAIADVTGCAIALHSLGLLGDAATRIVSPIAAGSGVVHAAHGALPVPVPAVLELLTEAGAPMRSHPGKMELCTPTGAALLTTLATGWGPAPDCVPLATGTGAGNADPETHPNVLRVLIGDGGASDWTLAEMHRVDTTVDDLDPRVWPEVLEALRSAGAADAWCSPVLMRKGRPGQVLSVLTEADRLDAVCRVVFEHTTTLGVRVSSVERRSLRRDRVEVHTAGGPVGVKRGLLGDRIITLQPEYDEASAAATAAGRPVHEVLAEVRAAAQEAL